MRVLYAYYGLSCADSDIWPSANQRISTDWVSSVCNGKTSCSGLVSVSVLRDPYYGCHKDFVAVAVCGGGRIISTHVPPEADGHYFSLAC